MNAVKSGGYVMLMVVRELSGFMRLHASRKLCSHEASHGECVSSFTCGDKWVGAIVSMICAKRWWIVTHSCIKMQIGGFRHYGFNSVWQRCRGRSFQVQMWRV